MEPRNRSRGMNSDSRYDKHIPTQFLHRKKKVREFPVPSQDVTTKLSLGRNTDVITELFLPKGSLVSDIPTGDGKLVNLFLRCSPHRLLKNQLCHMRGEKTSNLILLNVSMTIQYVRKVNK
jgi:hypothetical protein